MPRDHLEKVKLFSATLKALELAVQKAEMGLYDEIFNQDLIPNKVIIDFEYGDTNAS